MSSDLELMKQILLPQMTSLEFKNDVGHLLNRYFVGSSMDKVIGEKLHNKLDHLLRLALNVAQKHAISTHCWYISKADSIEFDLPLKL